MYGLGRFSVYSGFGLDRFHCTYISTVISTNWNEKYLLLFTCKLSGYTGANMSVRMSNILIALESADQYSYTNFSVSSKITNFMPWYKWNTAKAKENYMCVYCHMSKKSRVGHYAVFLPSLLSISTKS